MNIFSLSLSVFLIFFLKEDLSEKISNLINCLNNNDKQVMLFTKVYFKTIIREWIGIDKWRMDKFMMV